MQNITVGLVSAPGLPAKLIDQLKDNLEEDLQEQFTGNHFTWKVEMNIDRAIGAVDTVKEIMEETEHIKQSNKWNYAISLTDLPVFHGKNVVLADVHKDTKIGQISMPAFGTTCTSKKIGTTLLQLITEIYYRNTHSEDKIQFIEQGIGVTDVSRRKRKFKNKARVFRFSSIKRVEKFENEDYITV